MPLTMLRVNILTACTIEHNSAVFARLAQGSCTISKRCLPPQDGCGHFGSVDTASSHQEVRYRKWLFCQLAQYALTVFDGSQAVQSCGPLQASCATVMKVVLL